VYSFASRLTHWATAVLMVLAFSLVWLREDLPKGDLRTAMMAWHQWAGLLVLLLLLPRLLARWWGTVPAPAGMPSWQRLLARGTETGLYLLMVTQPLIGWLMTNLKGHSVSLFGLTLPALAAPNRGLAKQLGELHEFGGTLILIFVGLHVLGALYHHFWRREGVLGSMVGGRTHA
jgi:cytochrome b561